MKVCVAATTDQCWRNMLLAANLSHSSGLIQFTLTIDRLQTSAGYLLRQPLSCTIQWRLQAHSDESVATRRCEKKIMEIKAYTKHKLTSELTFMRDKGSPRICDLLPNLLHTMPHGHTKELANRRARRAREIRNLNRRKKKRPAATRGKQRPYELEGQYRMFVLYDSTRSGTARGRGLCNKPGRRE